MSGRSAAFRVARKNTVRNKKRTFYLVLLIAIPVMVSAMTSVIVGASYISPEEQATLDFGGTNIMFQQWGGGPEVATWMDEQIETLAPEAEILSSRSVGVSFGPEEYGNVRDMDFDDPLSEGMLTLVSGRSPSAADEVVLTEHLATILEAGVGDRVALETDGAKRFEVVGLATHPIYWRVNDAVLTPEGLDEFVDWFDFAGDGRNLLIRVDDDAAFATRFYEAWERDKYQFYPGDREWPKPERYWFLEDYYYAAMTADQFAELDRVIDEGGEEAAMEYQNTLFPNGVEVTVPEVYLESRSERLTWNQTNLVETGPAIGTGMAALILAEVAFIAGAAFATGTRRRLREIGLMGANGASYKQLRSTVVGEGLVIGLVGGLGGSLLAFLIVLLGRSTLQQFVERRIEQFPFSPLDIIGPILVAVIACVVAAWLPAKTAAGVPTLTALQGRMPVGAPKRWVIPVGLGLTGFGTVLLAVGLATPSGFGGAVGVMGTVLMIGGTALLAGPIVAWVSKHAERFPITSRIVLRDSGRQRGRAAAAVAATMVILMAPVAGLTALATDQVSGQVYGIEGGNPRMMIEGRYDVENDYELMPLTEQDLDLVASRLPGARIASFQTLDIPIEYPTELERRKAGLFVEDGGYYIGPYRMAVASDELLAMLDDQRLNNALAEDGMVLVGVEGGENTVTVDGAEVTISEVPVPVPQYSFPRVLVTEEVAAGYGAEPRETALVEVDAGLFANPFTSPFDPLWEGGGDEFATGGGMNGGMGTVILMGFLATMLIVLIVVATITALSAAEADSDLRTVVAVGATNSIRRKYLGLQSGLHTLIGAVLAVPLTLLLYKTVMMENGYEESGNFGVWNGSNVIIPWAGLALLVIGLPLAIGLITAAFVRSAPTTPPRRAT
jgi:ABC-type lipoprotein release transport system permease subunit